MIGNIIDAIAKGYDQPSCRVRVEQLESDKHQLENLLLEKQLQTAGVREHGAAMINGQHVLKSKQEPEPDHGHSRMAATMFEFISAIYCPK
jgi:hypothetical protein